MSRLSAKEKLQYYRTPEPIVDAIARYLTTRPVSSIRLLDPCAGTGLALELLTERIKKQHMETYYSQTIKAKTYGIEPEILRSREAFAHLDHVLQASFFSTTLSNGEGPDGGWQLLFLNPPYDNDTEVLEKGRKTRLEINFLQRATTKLCAEGILIWIVPQQMLKLAAPFLASSYERISCARFPDDRWQPDIEKKEYIPLYDQFQQIVLFAQKRRISVPAPDSIVKMLCAAADAGPQLRELSLAHRVQEISLYSIPNALAKQVRYFHAGSFDPQHTASLIAQTTSKMKQSQTGVWSRKEYLAARVPDVANVDLGIGTPMSTLKNAHLSVLAVAGIANRAVLTGKDGRRIIVKGSARKVPVYSSYENEDEIVEKITDTFETALWGTDLDTGGLIRVETGKSSRATFAVEFETMSLGTFLENFGASLTQQVALANPPRYTGEASLPWASDGLALLKRKPLGKQKEIILATVAGFLQQSRQDKHTVTHTAPIAEMATGKSFISLATAFLADRYASGGSTTMLPDMQLQHIFPLVILCPPIMARKWKREAELTLPNVRAVIVKRIGSVAPSDLGKVNHVEYDEDCETDTRVSDDIREFRAFDPDFRDTSLSAIGCADRVVRRIQKELDEWKQAYDRAIANGQTPPLKPCHIVIMTTSTAKLGKEWMPLYRMKVARSIDPATKKVTMRRDADGNPYAIPCCPSCFRGIKDERVIEKIERLLVENMTVVPEKPVYRKQEAVQTEAKEDLQLFLTEKDLLGTKERRIKRYCTECGEALWQYIASKPEKWQPYDVLRKNKATREALPLPDHNKRPACINNTFHRRYPLGDYILDRYKGFFHLVIADEVHEGADGTALDFARQRLASACGRMMGLTGTLSNGYSASLFRLYYTLNPSVREKFAYHEVSKWIDLYGRRQTIQKTYKDKSNEEGHGSSSDRRIGKPVIKELAGFAPQGLAHVLPCSTFLELSDVAPNLPPYREIIHETDLGCIGPVYDTFERETTNAIGQMLAKGDKSALSRWWNGLMNYPNMPYLGWTFITKEKGQIITAPALPEDILYPKEQALIQLVQQELKADRRVLIYTENTGVNDIMPRLKKLLEEHVKRANNQPLRVAILRSTTVNTINREAWLDKQVEAGCDVLICNPKLVKVGLDLLSFPTIVYMSLPKSTSDLRQSSRRSFRPGQTKPVNVVFMVYPTMEWRLLRLMAKKMKSSLMVEGKLPGEGLVSFGEQEAEDENDLYVQLAREVLASIEEGDPQEELDETDQLQNIFDENASIEHTANMALVVDGSLITEEQHQDEAPAEPETNLEITQVENIVEFPAVQGSVVKKSRKKAKPEQADNSEKVTALPTVVIERDAWAELRKKHIKPRRKHKKEIALESKGLWAFVESESEYNECKEGSLNVGGKFSSFIGVIQAPLW